MRATRTFKIGATAAVAVVAIIAPVLAQADEGSDETETTASVGSAAGQAPTRSTRTDRVRPGGSSTAGSSDSGANATPDASGPSEATGSGDATSSGDERASTNVPAGDATASALGPNPLFQNPLIWIGTPNPTPPPSVPLYEFEPLANLPGFTRPMFGWLDNFGFEACVLGLSQTNQALSNVGPYNTWTRSISGSGCA